MSDAHKLALAKGREQGRTVRDYLEALEASKPRRGRRRTPESVENRLKVVTELVETADNPLSRLQLVQERLNLETELAAGEPSTDVSTLQADFVKIARAYGERKGISYSAWRAIGVGAAVLKEAGISRTRS
jgi:hypothetical protein